MNLCVLYARETPSDKVGTFGRFAGLCRRARSDERGALVRNPVSQM
jgi:hypothetical protein